MTEHSPTALPEETDPFYIRPDQPEAPADVPSVDDDELVEVTEVKPDEEAVEAQLVPEEPETVQSTIAASAPDEWRDLELLELAMRAAEAVQHRKGERKAIMAEVHRDLLSTRIAESLNDPQGAPLKGEDARAELEVLAAELEEQLVG